MKIFNKISFILLIIIGLVLVGCASPTIVLKPTIPTPEAPPASGGLETVRLIVDGTENIEQLSRYEERSEKTQIGRSESLGVHLSDFWVEEPPPVTIRRMLENNLKAWGYQAVTSQQPIQLHGHVNKYALNSRAISVVEFQADGIIDVDLSVIKNGAQDYKGHYVGACTFKTATQIPNKENMGKLFNSCIEDFQKRLEQDNMLRKSLSSH